MEQVLQSSIPVTPSTGYEYDVTCSGGYSFDDVMRVTSSNDEMMVQWCQFIQLIPQCVSCPKCANKMHLAKSSSVWRCNRTNCHGQELSVRNGTIFSKSKLSIKLIIRVMYFFATKKSVKDTAKDLKIPNKTVSKWFSVFRDICSKEILPCDFKVGGRGRTVEIDETSLKKKSKYGRGTVHPDYWVFGGVERETNKWFAVVTFNNRTKPTLSTLIKQYILPGTTIISDKFASYVSQNERHTLENNKMLIDMGYKHMWVNHSKNFVNPDNGAHTNSIEGSWENKLKSRLKSMRGLQKDCLPAFIDEQLWRSWFFPANCSNEGLFKGFVTAVRKHTK